MFREAPIIEVSLHTPTLIPTLTPAKGTPVGTPLLRNDPSAVPKGEGLCIPLPLGEGLRVRVANLQRWFTSL